MLSITDAIRKAHEEGWYIYNLFENNGIEGREPWGCTLRQSTGDYRRRICHGSGHSPAHAILSAIESGEAVIEREISISAKSPQGFDVVAALNIPAPRPFVKRV